MSEGEGPLPWVPRRLPRAERPRVPPRAGRRRLEGRCGMGLSWVWGGLLKDAWRASVVLSSGNLVWWKMSLLVAGGLEPGDL